MELSLILSLVITGQCYEPAVVVYEFVLNTDCIIHCTQWMNSKIKLIYWHAIPFFLHFVMVSWCIPAVFRQRCVIWNHTVIPNLQIAFSPIFQNTYKFWHKFLFFFFGLCSLFELIEFLAVKLILTSWLQLKITVKRWIWKWESVVVVSVYERVH